MTVKRTLVSKITHNARIKWLDYLREPGRKKYERMLENPDNPEERCCLGHGCHVLKDDAGVTRILAGSSLMTGYTSVFYGGFETSMPKEVAHILDITPNGAFCEGFDMNGARLGCLAEVNDYTGLTMSEIATLIEEMWAEGTMMTADRDEGEPWTRDMVPAEGEA